MVMMVVTVRKCFLKEKGWICLDGDLSDPISCLGEDGGRYFLSKGGGDDYEGGNYDKN